MQKEKKLKLNCRMRLKSRWHPLSICQDHFQHKPRVTQIHKYTNTQMHKYQRHVCILGNLCPRRKTQYEVGNYFLVWGMYVWGMYVGEWAFWKLFSLLWPKYETNSTQIQEQWFGKYWGKTSLSDLKVKLWWGRSWIKGIKKMPDGNSSSDEELVVGNLFDDESGSDSSDESSSDEYESSSDEPLGPQPMFQGPQHLASDPRYIYVSVLRSSHFCQSHMTDNCLLDLWIDRMWRQSVRNYANGPLSNLQRVIDSLFPNAEVGQRPVRFSNWLHRVDWGTWLVQGFFDNIKERCVSL